MLRRAVFGHHFQHNDAEENALLHGEHYHTVHGNLIPHRTHVLPAVGQWRKSKTFYKILNFIFNLFYFNTDAEFSGSYKRSTYVLTKREYVCRRR